jgi:hypothetical protein
MHETTTHITSLEDLATLPPTAAVRRISLCADLRELPRDLLRFAATVEILDLSGNQLQTLPAWITELRALRVLFLSRNPFREVPAVLRGMPALRMLGMRACQIEHLPEDGLPATLIWLTLTDNALCSLPQSLGSLAGLQKVLLAGNRLRTLPSSLQSAKQLELLRLSANEFTSLPTWLFELPSLAWLALAGNPLVPRQEILAPLGATPTGRPPPLPWQQLTLGPELGRGATGPTFEATYSPPSGPLQQVAVKVFQAAISSDGSAADEIGAALRAGSHPALLSPLAPFEGHPQGCVGLVFRLLPPEFRPLAGPPSFESCTRDCYPDDFSLEVAQVSRYAQAVALAAAHLHARGIAHGDLYAHNTLVDGQTALLSDFGAACTYGNEPSLPLERIEVRAFGILLQELLTGVSSTATPSKTPIRAHLESLAQACMQEHITTRPTFSEIACKLNGTLQ